MGSVDGERSALRHARDVVDNSAEAISPGPDRRDRSGLAPQALKTTMGAQ